MDSIKEEEEKEEREGRAMDADSTETDIGWDGYLLVYLYRLGQISFGLPI